MNVIAAVIPQALREMPRWAPARTVLDDSGQPVLTSSGKAKREPINIHTGGYASFRRPETLATFDRALAYGEAHGCAFMWFSPPPGYIATDIDQCRDPRTGRFDERGQRALSLEPTYTEISPSETGIRQVFTGTLPGDAEGRKRGGIEISRAGFVSLTGHALPGGAVPIAEAGEGVQALWDELAPPKVDRPVPSSFGQAGADHEIIDLCRQARNSAKFERLWSGDATGYPSGSEADAALAAVFGFYTQDADQIERLLRESGLSRPKWDEQGGYLHRTITGALAIQSDAYTWDRPRRMYAVPEPPPEPEMAGPDASEPTVTLASYQLVYAAYEALVAENAKIRAETLQTKETLVGVHEVIENPTMDCSEKIVALNLSFEVTMKPADAGGWRPVVFEGTVMKDGQPKLDPDGKPIKFGLAVKSNLSAKRFTDHVKRFEAAGILSRIVKSVPVLDAEGVHRKNPDGSLRYITQTKIQMTNGADNALTMLRTFGSMRLPPKFGAKGMEHGGKRDPNPLPVAPPVPVCPNGCDADMEITTKERLTCTACETVVDTRTIDTKFIALADLPIVWRERAARTGQDDRSGETASETCQSGEHRYINPGLVKMTTVNYVSSQTGQDDRSGDAEPHGGTQSVAPLLFPLTFDERMELRAAGGDG